jgi:hypothetical protein
VVQALQCQENKERQKVHCEQAGVERDPVKFHELVKEISDLLQAKEKRLQGTVGLVVFSTPHPKPPLKPCLTLHKGGIELSSLRKNSVHRYGCPLSASPSVVDRTSILKSV